MKSAKNICKKDLAITVITFRLRPWKTEKLKQETGHESSLNSNKTFKEKT